MRRFPGLAFRGNEAAREWGEAGRAHAGCILVHGIDHRDHGPLLAGLDQLFTRYPNPIHWHDLAMLLPTH